MARGVAAVLLLPAASLNTPARTEMDAVPDVFVVGVNVDVYESPEPERAESVPPVTETSVRIKFADDSERPKVITALSPAISFAEPERVTVMVGAVVSRVIVEVAVAADIGPVLPAVSVAPLAANCGVTVPWPQLEMVTVRVAPVSEPGAYEHESAVPVLVKSAATTPVTDSENVSV